MGKSGLKTKGGGGGGRGAGSGGGQSRRSPGRKMRGSQTRGGGASGAQGRLEAAGGRVWSGKNGEQRVYFNDTGRLMQSAGVRYGAFGRSGGMSNREAGMFARNTYYFDLRSGRAVVTNRSGAPITQYQYAKPNAQVLRYINHIAGVRR